MGNKDLYQAVSTTPITGGRSNKVDKELNKKFNNSDKEIAKLKREVERLTKREGKKEKDLMAKAEKKRMKEAMSQPAAQIQGVPQRPRPNPDVPMTETERNELIGQINSLTPTQSEGIIKIVAEHAKQDEGQNYTFELTQLPVIVTRNLEAYVKKCIAENEKKRRRKEQDARRRKQKKDSKDPKSPMSEMTGNPPVQQV